MTELALRSPLLVRHGFAHGFSLRTGGVSEGAFATLNLGRTVGDDPRAVAENARRFADAIGVDLARLYETSQVHGREVVRVGAGDDVLAVRAKEADALVTRVPGAAVAVRTADCMPILMAHPPTGAVSAVHAGWRGVVARVVDAAIDALEVDPSELVVAIGPHVRADAFEVGEDVAREIAASAPGADVIVPRRPRPHADLRAAVRAQLAARGVDPANVDDVGGCTFTDAARFFSHRRDAGKTGRHLAAIAARRPSGS
ncbi:MAG TPA: peptidoglycan editing factor PgeF [Sandaracinaceae bacterium]